VDLKPLGALFEAFSNFGVYQFLRLFWLPSLVLMVFGYAVFRSLEWVLSHLHWS
jgi:hypothetical protein